MVGFVNVYKRRGDTSAFVVNRIKKIFGCKCGHMGTLDPLACGVLPVALGQSSRLFDYLLDKEKIYIAKFDFSYTTPSLDLETEKTFFSDRTVSYDEIQKVLPRFIGEIMQVPPDYSAKCVDGHKAYKLARRGEKPDLKAKKVFIKDIRVLDKTGDNEYSFEITCKGGTYIRSLCRDIAESLGVFGVMTSLERTKSGIFTTENAITLNDIAKREDLSSLVIPPDSAIDYEKVYLSDEAATRVLNGLTENVDIEDGLYRAYAFGSFLGVLKAENGALKVTYVRDI